MSPHRRATTTSATRASSSRRPPRRHCSSLARELRGARDARDAETGPGERLEASGIAYVRLADRNRARFRLLAAPELADKAAHPTLLAAYEDAFGVLLASVEECQRAGLVREDDTRKLAIAAWATVHGIAHLVVDGLLVATRTSGAPPDLARDARRALFKGLRKRR